MRVPLSFIIDDSTCLVNMGHFCMPQFATAWPDRDEYKKPWKTWPVEIPDAFVREFGEWCAEHGVKGKYSIVPYPACVGWLDRELPGWSRQELPTSLQLVRELMVPNWDIHPEMITHTRVIDLQTGRPLPEISDATMENSYPQTHKSVDELAAYLAYALRILKNCDLPCEGITTPGGFGAMVPDELSLAVQQAVRDVYGSRDPHYFKYVAEGDESAEPRIEHVQDATGQRSATDCEHLWGDRRLVRRLGRRPATGTPTSTAARDGTQGRLVELIQRGEPAIMLCHWPGMYTHGTKAGFAALQQVVLALEEHWSEKTIWMKLSEIARYWAARKLTRITVGAATSMCCRRRLPARSSRSRVPTRGPATAGGQHAPTGPAGTAAGRHTRRSCAAAPGCTSPVSAVDLFRSARAKRRSARDGRWTGSRSRAITTTITAGDIHRDAITSSV